MYRLFCLGRKLFKHLRFISMFSILNTLSKYTHFYISKNITSYAFLLVSKIIENLLQYILKIGTIYLNI